MRRDRDAIDWLISKTLGPFIARWHRRRVEREVDAGYDDNSYREWKSLNPGRCMYCAYTKWANEEHGQSLKIEQHRCREGNSPPHPLPRARVV
jgi:hypothetical protein